MSLRFSHLLKLCCGVFVFLCFACGSNETPTLEPNGTLFFQDLAYGTNERQVMDVWLPANRKTSTTRILVWIHSGGWFNGDKSEFDPQREWLKVQLEDHALISLNYRLFDPNTNENRFPTQEEDIRKAFEFIQSNAASWGISDKIVAAGASSGGHLALLQAYKHNKASNIEAVVAYFPPSDLQELFAFSPLTAFGLVSIVGGSPLQLPDLYRESSPISFVSPATVPTLLFHGKDDQVVPVSQSMALREKLHVNEVLHEAHFFEGQGHGFDGSVFNQSFGTIVRFIENHRP